MWWRSPRCCSLWRKPGAKAAESSSGLALAAAFLSRQFTLFAGLALSVRLWTHPRFVDRRSRWLNLCGFGAVTGLGIAAYLAFNHARFGNVFEPGYRYVQVGGFLKERLARGTASSAPPTSRSISFT